MAQCVAESGCTGPNMDVAHVHPVHVAAVGLAIATPPTITTTSAASSISIEAVHAAAALLSSDTETDSATSTASEGEQEGGAQASEDTESEISDVDSSKLFSSRDSSPVVKMKLQGEGRDEGQGQRQVQGQGHEIDRAAKTAEPRSPCIGAQVVKDLKTQQAKELKKEPVRPGWDKNAQKEHVKDHATLDVKEQVKVKLEMDAGREDERDWGRPHTKSGRTVKKNRRYEGGMESSSEGEEGKGRKRKEDWGGDVKKRGVERNGHPGRKPNSAVSSVPSGRVMGRPRGRPPKQERMEESGDTSQRAARGSREEEDSEADPNSEFFAEWAPAVSQTRSGRTVKSNQLIFGGPGDPKTPATSASSPVKKPQPHASSSASARLMKHPKHPPAPPKQPKKPQFPELHQPYGPPPAHPSHRHATSDMPLSHPLPARSPKLAPGAAALSHPPPAPPGLSTHTFFRSPSALSTPPATLSPPSSSPIAPTPSASPPSDPALVSQSHRQPSVKKPVKRAPPIVTVGPDGHQYVLKRARGRPPKNRPPTMQMQEVPPSKKKRDPDHSLNPCDSPKKLRTLPSDQVQLPPAALHRQPTLAVPREYSPIFESLPPNPPPPALLQPPPIQSQLERLQVLLQKYKVAEKQEKCGENSLVGRKVWAIWTKNEWWPGVVSSVRDAPINVLEARPNGEAKLVCFFGDHMFMWKKVGCIRLEGVPPNPSQMRSSWQNACEESDKYLPGSDPTESVARLSALQPLKFSLFKLQDNLVASGALSSDVVTYPNDWRPSVNASGSYEVLVELLEGLLNRMNRPKPDWFDACRQMLLTTATGDSALAIEFLTKQALAWSIQVM